MNQNIKNKIAYLNRFCLDCRYQTQEIDQNSFVFFRQLLYREHVRVICKPVNQTASCGYELDIVVCISLTERYRTDYIGKRMSDNVLQCVLILLFY